LALVPGGGDAATATQPRSRRSPPSATVASATTASTGASETASAGGYAVQVSSQHSETEAQSSFQALRTKYPDVLGKREPIIRRADLGAKGIYYRALVGPFASAEAAVAMCSSLKAAGGNCIVQKN
jgi:cell division septation protein DedD